MEEVSLTKIVFGVISSVFIFVGLIPYIRDIKLKKVQPHILSWAGWGGITGVGFVAMLSEGFTGGAILVGANFFACFGIAIYAKIKGVGVWNTSKYDYAFFMLGLVGVVLWQVFNSPDIAIGFAILADFCFGIPTIIKIYKHPKSETVLPWLMTSIAGLAGLVAISYVSFTEIAYPVYLAIYDTSALGLILYGSSKIRKIEKV
jgi:hypothetical protein